MNSFKQQCLELRRKDYSLNEIVEITGRSKTSVYFHIKSISLSAEKKQTISDRAKQRALRLSASRKGKSLKEHRRLTDWTPTMVLLVAHLMFDGELLKGRCRYHNRSNALIARVERLMGTLYDYSARKTINQRSGVISLGYYNVSLAAHLHERAAALLREIEHVPKDLQREFLRAFFDDEGCMDFRRNKRRVRGYQKDQRILRIIQMLLTKFDIVSVLREPNEVVITGKENLKKFQQEINFSPDVRINPNRANSIWKKDLEKRVLLDMAIKSFTR
jgi:hypothetical protein